MFYCTFMSHVIIENYVTFLLRVLPAAVFLSFSQAQLPGSSVILPITIFGVCAFICCLVSLWLPETAGRPLYQTTIEAEESPEDYGIPFLKNRAKSKACEIEMSKSTTAL